MIFATFNQTNKYKVKTRNHSAYTIIIIKNFLLIFFTKYKNEWKEHKF